MSLLQNPILPGFHPDPCIVRARDRYYIATSTFEWWPGVQIHQSENLGTWNLLGHALTDRSQLDMRGNPDSGGVWAPALSYADDKFWLIYSNIKSLASPFKDLRNYLVTADDIRGPWSRPVYLNSSGFDPSLFHDTNGRKWILNQIWKPCLQGNRFDGIALQELDVEKGRLVGEPMNIFKGTSLGCTEGPHLYRKDGYYYLVTAEGGTGWAHAITVARSKKIDGPYEISPFHPLLTSVGHPENLIQKAGHGSFVETPDGRWYVAHLCGRPIGRQRRCILGRETALQAIKWPADGWPRLAQGGSAPATAVDLPKTATSPYLEKFEDDFLEPKLGPHWNTLREPSGEDWLSLTERPGFLRLRGRMSLLSLFDQSLVGFRILHHHCSISVRLEFSPQSYQQRAGLGLYLNTANFYYAHLTGNGRSGRELHLLACDNRQCREILDEPLLIKEDGAVELQAVLDGESLQFQRLLSDGSTTAIGAALDATILSDDHSMVEDGRWTFTGPYIVLCAQDSGDSILPADFSRFRYQAL